MHKLFNSHKIRKELVFTTTFLSVFILALLMISPAAASVSDWEYSPENPVIGDTLSIEGSASPEEELDVLVNFEKTVSVSEGKYEYILEDVEIPNGFDNNFNVEATGAKNLNVRVKMLIWMTKSADASGNTATVSQSSVPPGTYIIKIDGDAAEGASSVDLKITAIQGIKANSGGDFSYSYNTKAVPVGDFEINVGGITKTVTIESESYSGGSSSSASSPSASSPSASSSSTSSPEMISDPEPTPSETLEETETPETASNPEENIGEAETKLSGDTQAPESSQNTRLFLNIAFTIGGFIITFGILGYIFKKEKK
ncbi:MAG: hypothetical protein PHF18_00835 [Methanosarcina sp.]|uniref:hypothetical protein n=1 Tax=Methanosarcina sp. TaxID=2213 RepID=UPI00261CBFCC|nr:hypothetical protein [Methanosarcina sp.]MDD3245410.1 hypothetical protein [Methanosarcina sp.]MDD4248025.1 hypothetical protein [Methanosarcina sp.]